MQNNDDKINETVNRLSKIDDKEEGEFDSLPDRGVRVVPKDSATDLSLRFKLDLCIGAYVSVSVQ